MTARERAYDLRGFFQGAACAVVHTICVDAALPWWARTSTVVVFVLLTSLVSNAAIDAIWEPAQ